MDISGVHPVKWARLNKHLTQKELADLAGMTQSHISMIESSEINGNINKGLVRIANALDMEITSNGKTIVLKEKVTSNGNVA